MLAPGKLRIDNNFINGNKLVKKNLSQPTFSFLFIESCDVQPLLFNGCSPLEGKMYGSPSLLHVCEFIFSNNTQPIKNSRGVY